MCFPAAKFPASKPGLDGGLARQDRICDISLSDNLLTHFDNLERRVIEAPATGPSRNSGETNR